MHFAGGLSAGDVLVVDNASIHFASAIRGELLAILASFGITLVFLPTYSPECNPCELVFSYVKRFLRNNRDPRKPLLGELLRAFARVDFKLMRSFYLHCLLSPLSR